MIFWGGEKVFMQVTVLKVPFCRLKKQKTVAKIIRPIRENQRICKTFLKSPEESALGVVTSLQN